MTPRQLDLAITAANRAQVTEYNARVEAAWLTAMLPNMKKPPKLKDLLIPDGRKAKRRRKTPAELEAAGRQLHAMLSAKASKP